ncbi:MAG: SPOR domain-containing protein [Rhodospirillaceae bacterium]|nr:SPOR domain-containing protein [Rhodospirillaceae bacterium]
MTPAQSAYKQPFMDNMAGGNHPDNSQTTDHVANQHLRHPTGNTWINRPIDMEDWREDQPVARQEWSLQIDDFSLGGVPTQDKSGSGPTESFQQPETWEDDQSYDQTPENNSFYAQAPMQPKYQTHATFPQNSGNNLESSQRSSHPGSSVSPTMASQHLSAPATPYAQPASFTGNANPHFSAATAPEESWDEQGIPQDAYADSQDEYAAEDTAEDTYESNVPQFLQGQAASSPKPSEKAYHSNNAAPKWRKFTYIAGGSLVVMVIAVLAMWPASKKPASGGVETLPLITAEATPVKIKAEPSSSGDPATGDLQIYQGMNGANFDPEAVEQLLPRGENPQNPSQLAQIDNPNGNNDLGNPNNANSGVPVNNALTTISLDRPPVKPLVTGAVLTPTNAGVAANNSSPPLTQPTAITTPASGIYYAQLASVRTVDGAQAAASKFQRDLGSVLGNVKTSVKQVDLGAGKGITYRVVVGPVLDRNTANTLCQSIKGKGQDCFVAVMP